MAASRGGRGELTVKRVQAVENMRRIEKIMRRGYTNQQEIALRVGMTQASVSRYMKLIYARWTRCAPEEYEAKITARIRQLEEVIAEAWNAFEKSKREEEKIDWITRPCTACAGAETIGEFPDPPCKECDGTGKVTTEHSSIKGREGDPAFLNVVRDCTKECARLETLILNGGQMRPRTVNVQHSGMVVQMPSHLAAVGNDEILRLRGEILRLAAQSAEADASVPGVVTRSEVALAANAAVG